LENIDNDHNLLNEKLNSERLKNQNKIAKNKNILTDLTKTDHFFNKEVNDVSDCLSKD